MLSSDAESAPVTAAMNRDVSFWDAGYANAAVEQFDQRSVPCRLQAVADDLAALVPRPGGVIAVPTDITSTKDVEALAKQCAGDPASCLPLPAGLTRARRR